MTNDRETILITRIKNKNGNLFEYESESDIRSAHNKIHKWSSGYSKPPEWIDEVLLKYIHERCLLHADRRDIDLNCSQDEFENTRFLI